MNPARGGGGYWIDPEKRPGRAPRPRQDTRDPAGDGGRTPVPARHKRRVRLGVGLSLMVLVVLAVMAALVLTGRVVVPGLSAKIYPIHYQEDIERVAAKYGQDPYLVAAMVKTESGYNPGAESGVGAVGLMQLMPATAEWVASQSGAWEDGDGPVLTDPVDSLELGVWYLDYLGDLYTDGTFVALAAYNAGLGNVDDWIEAAGGRESFDESDIPFPETKQYVERVEHYKELYERIHPGAFSQASQ